MEYKDRPTEMDKIRVIQRNLVYVSNIPPEIACEAVLVSCKYFGKYGNIQKCIVNQSKSVSGQILLHNAYITYEYEESAVKCIKDLTRSESENSLFKVTFGTTRYCSYFINGQKCPKVCCLFLHRRNRDSEVLRNENTQINEIIEKLKVSIIQERGGKGKKESRFLFARNGSAGNTELNGIVQELSRMASPSKETIHLSSGEFEKIMGSDSWVDDVIRGESLGGPESEDIYLISSKVKGSK